MIWSRKADLTQKACPKDIQAHCLYHPKMGSHTRHSVELFTCSKMKTERTFEMPLFNLFGVFIRIWTHSLKVTAAHKLLWAPYFLLKYNMK